MQMENQEFFYGGRRKTCKFSSWLRIICLAQGSISVHTNHFVVVVVIILQAA